MASKSFTFLHLSRFLIPTHVFLPLLLGIVILTINSRPTASVAYYNNHSCSSNFTFTPNSSYDINLAALLSNLSHEARLTHFRNTTSGTVYGLFMCRGDVSPSNCQECVETAVEDVTSFCPHLREAIIWYDECMLRYSYRNFFGAMEEWPRHHWKKSGKDDEDIELLQSRCFYSELGSLLKDLMTEAPMALNMFALKEAKACRNTSMYGFAQCTLDLSTDNCSRCLRDAAAGIHTSCCGDGVGERFVFPSCVIRYEIYAFAFDSGTTWMPPTTTDERKEIRARKIAIIVAVLVVVSVMLFCLSCYFLRTKARKCRKAILRENFGHDVTPMESLQYDLATIDAATNKFSDENLIGRGGFGEVYKGILPEDQKIAIKKLSTSSRQGGDEFKNEVLLIAKLQHKNLVRLLGFCLDEKEKMLIYEYVPNGSLDYFLFDSQDHNQLTWCQRYKVIEGIARGILYLHEDSRLKVIHRDLKPSNILLDDNMNPKISDFGMARMIVADHPQESTKRIVGTYGYMSPEYAMYGKFSIKSDIFSFGVMILEIISGKKNSYSYESGWMNDLLSYAWKQWRDHAPLELLDPTLKASSYSESEVVKCIHIGLLCVQENPDCRPTIATIASYLSNLSVEMPYPQEPAFVMLGGKELYIVGEETSSSQLINPPTFINEMSISNLITPSINKVDDVMQ